MKKTIATLTLTMQFVLAFAQAPFESKDSCLARMIQLVAKADLEIKGSCVQLSYRNTAYLNGELDHEIDSELFFKGDRIVTSNDLFAAYRLDSFQLAIVHEARQIVVNWVPKKPETNKDMPDLASWGDSLSTFFHVEACYETGQSYVLDLRCKQCEAKQRWSLSYVFDKSKNVISRMSSSYTDPEWGEITRTYELLKVSHAPCKIPGKKELLQRYAHYELIDLTGKFTEL